LGKRPAYNKRFSATAAGSADLKGSAEIPPLRHREAAPKATRHPVGCKWRK